MIPRLFTPDPAKSVLHENNDNLDVFGQVIQTNGLGVLTRCTSAVVTSSLEDGMSIEMTVLDDDPLAPSINVGSIVSAKANKNGRRQAFVIEEIQRNLDGTIEIYGVSYAQHMMRVSVVWPGNSVTTMTTKERASHLLATRSSPGRLVYTPVGADPAKTALTFPHIPLSVAELFNGDFEQDGVKKNLLSYFGGELEFDNETVYWYDHMGQTSNLKVVPGKNMTEFAKSDAFELESSVTVCEGYYWDEETGTAVRGYGVSPYDPVEGTEKYLAPVPYQTYACVDFTDEFDEVPTAAQIDTISRNWIASKGVNKSTIEVSFDALQNDAFGLGDLVRVVNEQYTVDVQKRIVGYKYDSLAEQYVSVEIGDPRTTINEAIGSVKSTTVKASSSGGGSGNYIASENGTGTNTTLTWKLADESQTATLRRSGSSGSYALSIITNPNGSNVFNILINSSGVRQWVYPSELTDGLAGKQDVLTSGTNIKTVNNTSLLGSGNLSVQPTLSWDSVPVKDSTKPVTSGGLYTNLVGYYTGEVTFNSAITTIPLNNLRRIGRMVMMTIRFTTPSTLTSGFSIGTIPTGFRPMLTTYAVGQIAWAKDSTAIVTLNTAGNIAFVNQAYEANKSYVVSATWLTTNDFPS